MFCFGIVFFLVCFIWVVFEVSLIGVVDVCCGLVALFTLLNDFVDFGFGYLRMPGTGVCTLACVNLWFDAALWLWFVWICCLLWVLSFGLLVGIDGCLI